MKINLIIKSWLNFEFIQAKKEVFFTGLLYGIRVSRII